MRLAKNVLQLSYICLAVFELFIPFFNHLKKASGQ